MPQFYRSLNLPRTTIAHKCGDAEITHELIHKIVGDVARQRWCWVVEVEVFCIDEEYRDVLEDMTRGRIRAFAYGDFWHWFFNFGNGEGVTEMEEIGARWVHDARAQAKEIRNARS